MLGENTANISLYTFLFFENNTLIFFFNIYYTIRTKIVLKILILRT